jgi:hypothetical protein
MRADEAAELRQRAVPNDDGVPKDVDGRHRATR